MILIYELRLSNGCGAETLLPPVLAGPLQKREAAVLVAMSPEIPRLLKSLPSAGSKAAVSSNGG